MADMKRKTISVVTPCYNEELNIAEAYEAVRQVFETHLPDYQREHIFCDNASTDASQRMLRELAARDPHVKVILNARNFGPMKSNYNGVMAATGDAVLVFLPCDLQDPPEMLPDFVKKWEEGYEIVYGIRAVREEGWLMRAVRGVYYQLLTRFSEVRVPPGVGDYQLVDRRIIESMREVRDGYPFLRMMTFEVGGPSYGISYTWLARKRGFSKNRMSALVDQGLNGLISFTTAPLRIGLYLGFMIALLSLLYAVGSVVGQLIGVGRVAPPGVPTLIVALFFFAGVQLFFMGLIAEYIIAIYSQVRSKPVVFERERLNF
jgi:glycosyltransferase involved in cell wall biosynthesis